MSRDLSVVAIVAAYNEADVIEPVVRDLIANGVSVYLIDDGSTDATPRLLEPLVGRGVIAIERLAAPSADDEPHRFALHRLLQRKTQLAAELDADWFINHDADEFREAPWTGVSLLEGIRRVDALGYNAIDFADFDFWPTHDGFEAGTDVRQAFDWYSDAATYNRAQTRCWKKTPGVDLVSTAGHDVQFEHRRVFPIRFISRHYPIRGQAHGERKVFRERRLQFSPDERARQWHVQYDDVQEGASFIRDTCDLTRYDGDAVRMTLALRHRGVEALEASVAQFDAAREEISRRDCRIAELNGVVEVRQRDLASLRAALDSRAVELGEVRVQLAQVHDALHTRNVELGEVHEQLGRVQAENATLREDVERRDDQISQLRAATEQQALVISKARSHAEIRDRQFASQALELVSTRAGQKDVRARLEALQQSWSWRVTAPARVLLRLLRGY